MCTLLGIMYVSTVDASCNYKNISNITMTLQLIYTWQQSYQPKNKCAQMKVVLCIHV